MDRATLFSLVLAETTRPDKAAELPDLLQLAEAKISRELRCQEMLSLATLDTSSGSAALPSDYLGPRSVYDTRGPFQQVGLMEYRTRSHDDRVFAIGNGALLCRAASVELEYFARPAAMAVDGDTTAVLDAHPDLYVALLSAYVLKRTQDLELAATYDAQYMDARDTLNELAERQRGAARIGKPYSFGGCPAF